MWPPFTRAPRSFPNAKERLRRPAIAKGIIRAFPEECAMLAFAPTPQAELRARCCRRFLPPTTVQCPHLSRQIHRTTSAPWAPRMQQLNKERKPCRRSRTRTDRGTPCAYVGCAVCNFVTSQADAVRRDTDDRSSQGDTRARLDITMPTDVPYPKKMPARIASKKMPARMPRLKAVSRTRQVCSNCVGGATKRITTVPDPTVPLWQCRACGY